MALGVSLLPPGEGSRVVEPGADEIRALDLVAGPARAAAARSGSSGTCFGAQAEGLPAAEAAKVSTVSLAIAPDVPGNIPDFASGLPRASGFVVAGSDAGGGNRIVTARHVALYRTLVSGEARIHVLDSRGRYIGVARVVATASEPRPGRGDAAVLEISKWAPGGHDAFAGITGLSFAATGIGGYSGVAGIPAGLFLGGSGAALVDPTSGLALGILTGALPTAATVDVTAGDIRRMWGDPSHGFSASAYRLRAMAGYWAEALPPELLPALGIQAASFEHAAPSASRPREGFIASFSETACTVSEVTVSGFVPWERVGLSLDPAADIPSLAVLTGGRGH